MLCKIETDPGHLHSNGLCPALILPTPMPFSAEFSRQRGATNLRRDR
jgi:hypothetical protein